MNKGNIRILLADDHMLMRMGLVALFNTAPDMEVVGEARNGKQAVELADTLSPDVVIMDLMMSGTDGAEATRLIRESHLDAKVIILTSFSTSADLARALSYGAVGAQLKGSSTDNLLAAVRTVAAGGTAIEPEVQKLVRAQEKPPQLTDRQAEILKAVVEGLTTDAIARQQGISPSAVKQHVALICNKLGAATRSEAVAIALRKHLLKI